MYETIDGYISAEEAADELVRHTQMIAEGVKRGENLGFEIRLAGVEAIASLLAKYVVQLRENKSQVEES